MVNQMASSTKLLTWLAFITAISSVRITHLNVPQIFTLDRASESHSLDLNCEYEIGPREKGFVLKWLFNNHSIYQWIPSVKGFAMGIMKSKIDTNILKLDGPPGAISIQQPDWNMTGEYTCAVQTFESTDKKSSKLQIIVPETNFILETRLFAEQSAVDVMCAVRNVFPEPRLSIMFDTQTLDTLFTYMDKVSNGLYSITVKTRVSKTKVQSPTPISCAFFLLGTNYTKRKETIFYDKSTKIQPKLATLAAILSISTLNLYS